MSGNNKTTFRADALKWLKSKTYIKSEIDSLLTAKANSNHNHSGYLTANDITGKADKTYVDTELAKKVNTASGKGLSSNDFTQSYITKINDSEQILSNGFELIQTFDTFNERAAGVIKFYKFMNLVVAVYHVHNNNRSQYYPTANTPVQITSSPIKEELRPADADNWFALTGMYSSVNGALNIHNTGHIDMRITIAKKEINTYGAIPYIV